MPGVHDLNIESLINRSPFVFTWRGAKLIPKYGYLQVKQTSYYVDNAIQPGQVGQYITILKFDPGAC